MKRTIYIILWILLGLILSSMAHAAIEIYYLKWLAARGIGPTWILNGACALPLWLFIILPILGVVFGFWAGPFFWQKVYVGRTQGK